MMISKIIFLVGCWLADFFHDSMSTLTEREYRNKSPSRLRRYKDSATGTAEGNVLSASDTGNVIGSSGASSSSPREDSKEDNQKDLVQKQKQKKEQKQAHVPHPLSQELKNERKGQNGLPHQKHGKKQLWRKEPLASKSTVKPTRLQDTQHHLHSPDEVRHYHYF